MKQKLLMLAIAGMALSGCQTQAELQTAMTEAKPAPASVKAAIVRDARDYLVDPYSVRDAEISYMQFNKHSKLHWVCVKANAKNRMGGYTGRQAVEVVVRNGQLVSNLPNSPACNSPSLKWQAFPELEALRQL
ncbi:hypothetical protein M2360_001042 [Rhizobium sp. SG_E_25_P2]|uniref:hypothetical protein n=1 Tax=Rhizobium sp. SG_E_25_P2 TaxID=2879942 RepID=UPI0024763F83|nr:hypothetical protein [Rhizobium sp. SG_E_25_P2]MDH6265652.1 hypothetical protein [Rhizobium sp. SG_E_25_P2]